MNEFVSWCRHLLVSFLFHALTSLHPPSFYRNDFSTCIYRSDSESKNLTDFQVLTNTHEGTPIPKLPENLSTEITSFIFRLVIFDTY